MERTIERNGRKKERKKKQRAHIRSRHSTAQHNTAQHSTVTLSRKITERTEPPRRKRNENALVSRIKNTHCTERSYELNSSKATNWVVCVVGKTELINRGQEIWNNNMKRTNDFKIQRSSSRSTKMCVRAKERMRAMNERGRAGDRDMCVCSDRERKSCCVRESGICAETCATHTHAHTHTYAHIWLADLSRTHARMYTQAHTCVETSNSSTAHSVQTALKSLCMYDRISPETHMT